MSEEILAALQVVHTLHNKIGLTSAQMGDLAQILDKTPGQILGILQAASDKWASVVESVSVPARQAQPGAPPTPPTRAEAPRPAPASEGYGPKTYATALSHVESLKGDVLRLIQNRVMAFPNGGSLPLDVCRAVALLRAGATEVELLQKGLAQALMSLAAQGFGSATRRYPGRLFPHLFKGHAWPIVVTESMLRGIDSRVSSPRQKARLRLVEMSYRGETRLHGFGCKTVRAAEARCAEVGVIHYILNG